MVAINRTVILDLIVSNNL